MPPLLRPILAAVDVRMAHVHASCLAGADWAQAHRGHVALVGAPLVTLLIALINQHVLLDFPNSGDEYAYLYQARTLAAGRLWNVTAASPGMFAFNYITEEPARTFGSFPFGWPLALAVAMVVHLPVWLLNAGLGAATLALVWTLGSRLHGPRAGALAAVLVAVSPFFLFNAASYFSHTFCGVLLLGAACLAARADRSPWWVPVSCGLLIGWAVVTRYFTGVACALPIVMWLLRPGVDRRRATALVALGGLPWIALLMAYDLALTGNLWQLTTTPGTVSHWFADGVMLRGADILATQLLRALLWTPPALGVAYLVYLTGGRGGAPRGGLAWLPLGMAGALYFYVERGGNQYGPRFFYEVFLFLAVYVAAHLVHAADWAAAPRRDRWLFTAVTLSVALMPASLVAHAFIERRVIEQRMDPFALADAAGLQHALVLIGGRVGSARSMAALDLTRNDLGLTNRVLYGLDRGEAANCAPAARRSGRATFLYAWDAATAQGSLRPLICPE